MATVKATPQEIGTGTHVQALMTTGTALVEIATERDTLFSEFKAVHENFVAGISNS